MKTALRMQILVCAVTAIALAQSSGDARQQVIDRPTVILEVVAEEFDIAWKQGYLYLRVLSDGHVESEVMTRKAGEERFQKADTKTTRRVLPAEQLMRLQALLSEQPVLQLQSVYKQRIVYILDAGTVWDISIPRRDRAQKIRVVAFMPDEAKARGRAYPEGLLRLGCTIDNLRAETTGEHLYQQNECRRVLGER